MPVPSADAKLKRTIGVVRPLHDLRGQGEWNVLDDTQGREAPQREDFEKGGSPAWPRPRRWPPRGRRAGPLPWRTGRIPHRPHWSSPRHLFAARGTGPDNGREKGKQIRNGVSGNRDATAREDVDVGDTVGYEGGREEPSHSKATSLANAAPRGKKRAGTTAAEGRQ